VAGLALLAELALVLVVFLVTAEAVSPGLVLVQNTGVAGRALGLNVFAEQRVLGLLVVIEDRDAPVPFDMTALAFVAEFPLVAIALIVLLVARDTLRRGGL